MSSLAVSPRSAAGSGRVVAVLVAVATGLVPALVFGPHLLAANRAEGGLGDQPTLVDAAGGAFVEYWNSGRRGFTPDLADLVDYWFRFHLVKAAIAAILLAVLAWLGVLVWKAFLRTDGPRAGTRIALLSAGVGVTMLALLSLVIVIANVQGTVAPFTSVLTLLPIGAANGRLAQTLEQVRQQLAGHQTPPALELMISDNVRYHLAVAVMATTMVVVLIGCVVLLWKRYARTPDRRTRRLLASYAVFSALLALAMALLATANITVTADPVQALVGFFAGGY